MCAWGREGVSAGLRVEPGESDLRGLEGGGLRLLWIGRVVEQCCRHTYPQTFVCFPATWAGNLGVTA